MRFQNINPISTVHCYPYWSHDIRIFHHNRQIQSFIEYFYTCRKGRIIFLWGRTRKKEVEDKKKQAIGTKEFFGMKNLMNYGFGFDQVKAALLL
jgi:hypothetical protein